MVNLLCVLMIIIPGTVRCLTFTQNGTTDDKNSFECNTNVSLVCQTQNGRDIIILEINNTQLVNCVTRCYVNTPLLGKYTVTHNFDEGTIRLDIPEITDADASNEFICRGDSTSISTKPIIKVFPQKSSTELIINETNGTNVVEIKALTGCVLLQYNLTFIWNKTRYSNGTILEPLSTEGFITKNTDSAEDSKCIPSDHCGGEARSSTLTFTEETSGGIDYFITCTIVINENVTRNTSQTYTVISERKFALKEENVNDVNLGSTGCFSETGCTIGVAIAIILLVIIILLVVIIIFVTLRKRKSIDDFPDSPTDFRLITNTKTSATFTWTPRPYPQDQNTFLLCYNGLNDYQSAFKEIKVNGTAKTIKNLQPGCHPDAPTHLQAEHDTVSETTNTLTWKPGLPEDPVDFHLVDDTLTETTAEFCWKPGKYRKYEQTFVISYWLEGDGENITNVTVNDTHEKTISHSVDNLQEGKQYVFCIRALNEIGMSNISETVFVQTKGLPDEPRHFLCVDDLLTETTATFMWEPGEYRRYKQTFVISYFLEHDVRHTFEEIVNDTTENHIVYTVTNLKAGNQYKFQIRAENSIGVSNSGRKLIVQTKGLPEEPKHFCLLDNLLTETSATFTWVPGVYRKYAQTFVIRYYATNTEIHQYEEQVEDTFESTITHTVSKLDEGTEYEFILYSINKIGVSKATDTITVETKGKPDDPADLIATPKSATSITIRWTPGQYRRDIQHFVIKYRRVTRSSKRKWKTLTYQEMLIFQETDSNQLHYEITGLQPASRYEVFVYAENCFGKSASTPVQQVSTEVLAKHQHNVEINEQGKLAYELKESEYSLASSEVLNKIQTQPVCRLGGSITTLNIYFTSRNNQEPKHPFFPEMIEAFSSLLRCNAHLECVILYKMKMGDKELEIAKLSKEDSQAISTYVKGKTNIVQLCTEAIGRQILLWNETQFDAQDFKIEEFNSNVKHTFADSVILKLVCLDLIKCNIEIKEAYPSMLGAVELPSLVCFLDRNIEVPSFRGFPLKMRIIDDFVNESSKLENSVEKESDEYKRVLKQHFEDINVTHAEHSRNLLSKHSNIEALSVSFVKMSGNGAVQICPCIVIYCKFKSAVPYKEDTFPRTLHHPLKNISFQTDVREGYFTLCPYFAQGSKEWNRELAIGCSIGEINTDIATTVGPFVDVIETHETCFLTVRHLFLPITRRDDQLEGLKVVQPADCDLPPIQHIQMPGRECGAVIASVFSEEIDAALVKVADERKPARGHFVTVTREELRKAGLSQSHIPTFDNGDMLTAAGLQIGGDATAPILKIGSRTGLTMGQLCTVDGIAKLTNDPLGFDFGYNGISLPHYFRNQLLVRSFHNQPFCLPGDSGSAVFLLDSGPRLKCIGIVIGIFSDYQAVVTPIKSVLDILGQKYGNRTLILKQFNLNEMEFE